MDAERPGGAADVAAVVVERLLDVLALEPVERQFLPCPEAVRRREATARENRLGEVFHGDERALRKRRRALDDVSQLTHVPGPPVRGERVESRLVESLDPRGPPPR